MIDNDFYLIAAYCVGACYFSGFSIFFIWRCWSLRRHIRQLEQRLAGKKT